MSPNTQLARPPPAISFAPRPWQDDEILILKLLAWADSSMTYRRRYLNTYVDINTLDILCLDNDNPRSLSFQAHQLQTLLAELPHAAQRDRNPIDQAALRVTSRIGLADLRALASEPRKPKGRLDTFFAEIVEDLSQLAMALERAYFAHTEPQIEQAPKLSIG